MTARDSDTSTADANTDADPATADALGAITGPDAELIREVIGIVRTHLADSALEGYARSWSSPDQVTGWIAHVRGMLDGLVATSGGRLDLATSTGCDYGSWYGLPSLLMHRLSGAKVVGVDVDEHIVGVARRWQQAEGVDAISFVANGGGPTPLPSASMDWVLISQVLCNAGPELIEPILHDAARLLRPGGVLVLNDSNNPHCADTMVRLRRRWKQVEGGQDPDGVGGPTRRARAKLIRELAPDLDEAAVLELARATCYHGGDELRRVVERHLAGDLHAPTPFDPDADRVPVDARTGRAHSQLTDPYVIADALSAAGLMTSIGVSPTASLEGPALETALSLSQGFYVRGRARADHGAAAGDAAGAAGAAGSAATDTDATTPADRGTRPLRIAVLGNMGNNAYRVCCWLRAMGWSPVLYMMPHDKRERSLPESIDRELAGPDGYPDWIRRYRSLDGTWLPKPNRDAALIEEEFDVVLTSGTGIRAAPHFSELPVVHMSLGGDTNEIPWRLFKRGVSKRARKDALMARIGLRRVKAILTGYEPDLISLDRLGHSAKTHVWGYPEDVLGNSARVDQELLAELTARYADRRRIVMFLSRFNFADPSHPSYKGAEHLVGALRSLVHDDDADIGILIGDHGTDIEAGHRLIEEAGLADRVEWVPHLPYWKLLTYLSIPNAIVVDEIDPRKGEISGIAREALSVGAMIVKSFDRGLNAASFGDGYPLPSADDEASLLAVLRELIALDRAEFDARRATGFEWAAEFMHYEPAMRRLVDHLLQAWYQASRPRG